MISLTQEQIKEWPDSDKFGDIQTITMLYDHVNDMIILNSSHNLYDVCVMLTECYLLATHDEREQLKEKTTGFISETDLLDKIILIRQNQELEVAI